MITAWGMSSSLGCDADTSCAAARAGILRLSELQNLNFGGYEEFGRETLDGFPPVVGHVAPVGYGYTAIARLAILGASALGDTLDKRPIHPAEADATGFFLNLSDHYIERSYAAVVEVDGPPRERDIDGPFLAQMILARVGLRLPERNCRVYRASRVGFAQALSEAVRDIAAGLFQRCIVGAVDSSIDPGFLVAAAGMRVLRTGDNPVGFLPGEAAAFVLVESPVKVRAGVRICGIGFSEGAASYLADDPSTGEELADAVSRAIESSDPSVMPAAFWLGDLNGTEKRAMDWGHAIVRLQSRHRMNDLPTWIPALSFGETGAASGAIATAMISRAYQRGYAPGRTSLMWLSAEDGGRAAIVLSSCGEFRS